MTSLPNLDQMTPDQLRALAAQLISKVDTMGRKIHRDQTIIEQLTHEIAILKRHRFAKRSEQISPEQGNLLDDLLSTDLEAKQQDAFGERAGRPFVGHEERDDEPDLYQQDGRALGCLMPVVQPAVDTVPLPQLNQSVSQSGLRPTTARNLMRCP